jgi:SIR2-like domain
VAHKGDGKMAQNRREAFQQLARKLALNLIHVSIDEKEVPDAIAETMNSEVNGIPFKDQKYRPERFVVVVGAGASYDANQNIPLAQEAMIQLKEILTENDDKILTLFDDELQRLETVYKLNKDEFETQLFALGKFYSNPRRQENLVNALCDVYDHKYYPGLCYELLAHLFKHRFIDVIINFNFDETLDRAITDELCQGDYYKVISDGESPNDINDLMIEKKFKKPLYIKPHGTASHKSTMRFTRKDYFQLPMDIEQLLKNVLYGKTSSKKDDAIPVNMIVIGFNMQSIEFNRIISSEFSNIQKIYYINPMEPSFDTDELKKLEIAYRKGGFFPISKGNNLFPRNTIDPERHSILDELMLQLWQSVQDNFDAGFKPRTIARHQLISNLFASKKSNLKDPAQIEHYLKDRTYIELALSIAKAKGFLNMHQLTYDRTGLYYNLYKNQKIKNNNTNGSSNDTPATLIEYCKKLALKKVGYAREAYKLTPETNQSNDLIVSKKEFEKNCIEKIFKILTKKGFLSDSTRKNLIKFQKEFTDTMTANYHGAEVEVCPRYRNIYNNIFMKPKVLSTWLALRYYSEKLLNSKWDSMLHVAETGEWLLRRDISKWKNKKIAIIVADSTYVEELKNKFKNHLYIRYRIDRNFLAEFVKEHFLEAHRFELEDIEKTDKNAIVKEIKKITHRSFRLSELKFATNYSIYFLPWWLHNQHMSIFLQSQEDRMMKIDKSIYFTRRLRSTNINPILLDEEKDNEVIHESFAAYLLRAEKTAFQVFTRKHVLKRIALLKKEIF